MLINKFQAMRNDLFYIAIVCLSIASVLTFLTWSFYTSPKLAPDYTAKMQSDMKMCIEFAQEKGFESDKGGSRVVEVFTTNFEDPKFMFATAESVILNCQNMDMQRFCMGSGDECGLDSHGMKMIFKYEKPLEY